MNLSQAKIITLKAPTPKQREFYERTLDHDVTLMVGGVGSGKSVPLATFGIRESLIYQGNQGMFIRRTLQELMETTHVTFLEECPPELIIKKSRDESGGMNYWIRPLEWNGLDSDLSLAQFRSSMHGGRQDPDKFKSINLGWASFEEISELDKSVFLMLLSRLRRQNSGRRAAAATNPPNPDHWLEEFFNLDTHGEGRKKGFYSLKSKTTDNPHLPADYVEKLKQQWPASWVHRYVEGNVGFLLEGDPVFEQMFKYSLHVADREADPSTILVRSWDIGYGRTPAVSWHQFVKMPDGRIRWHVLDELMWANPPSLKEFYVRALVRQQETFGLGWESRDVYDPAGAAKDVQTNQSAVDVLREVVGQHGISTDFMTAADKVRNSIVYRIGLVNSWLVIEPDGFVKTQIHPRCQTIIGALQGGYQYQKDKTTGEKVAVPIKNHWSHLIDTLMYAGVNVLDYDKMIVDPSLKASDFKAVNAGIGMTANRYLRQRRAS